MTILILILLILLVLTGYLGHKLRLYHSYNKYYLNQMDELTKRFDEKQEEKEKTLEKLNEVAYTNPITKLGNIDFLLQKSQKLFKENPNTHFSLIAFNIYNIGKINQLFGPTEGDRVVLHASKTLREIGIREQYVYAQIYSNLFGIIVKDLTQEEIVRQIGEITAMLKDYSEQITIESAFGIYEIEDTSQPFMQMVNACMLAQKFIDDPKSCNYKFYSTELESTFTENMKMSQEMEEAMEQHKFLMYLQPIVDLKTFHIVGAEALVRWDYPGKGILSPYAFIPLFESTNLVEKLDYYMWEECLKTIRRWIDRKVEPTPISMNISQIHFKNKKFIYYLNDLCEHYLIDKKYLILELPEKGISKASSSIGDIVTALKDNGYTLCIDNFGSVNSPLNILRDLPIDEIKIDRSFLNENSKDEDGRAILRYLIAMAKEVGLTVVTEGVETLKQVNFLGEIGSDFAQGYFFGKPVSQRDFDSLNHSLVQRVYQSNEYYPTFEDLEQDLDLIAFMLDEQQTKEATVNAK